VMRRGPDLELFFIRELVQLHSSAGPFAQRHMKLAAYERELIGLVQAVRH